MKVLGSGFHSVVVEHTRTTIKKFYSDRNQWINEIRHLQFLHSKNLNFRCVPKVYEYGIEPVIINNKKFLYWVTMDRVSGKTLHEIPEHSLVHIGKTLNESLTSLNTTLSTITEKQYITETNLKPSNLLHHILYEKGFIVKANETDPERIKKVETATQYLEERKEQIGSESCFGHQDLNLKNIMVDERLSVSGFVDWASLGYMHPSIVLYQLAKEPIWKHFISHYETSGNVIQKDLLYAATTIHVAWSKIWWENKTSNIQPIACQLDEHYQNFLSYIQK